MTPGQALPPTAPSCPEEFRDALCEAFEEDELEQTSPWWALAPDADPPALRAQLDGYERQRGRA